MRLNLAMLALSGGLALANVRCGETEEASPPGAAATITATEMTQLGDGSWSTSTRTIPAPEAPRRIAGDVAELQSALTTTTCSQTSTIVLYQNTGYTGNVLCLAPTGTIAPLTLPGSYQSGYTMKPLYLYNSAGTLIFTDCDTTFRYSSNFGSAAVTAREASELYGPCHF
jgi:hypothetical protein